jgi:hypothetical protein
MPRRHHALVMMCGDEPHNSIDPPDETPQFDHGGGSKRRRIASADPFMDAISSRTARVLFHSTIIFSNLIEPKPYFNIIINKD